MPILSKTSYLIFIVSNFLGTVQSWKIPGFFVAATRNRVLLFVLFIQPFAQEMCDYTGADREQKG